jgi:capsular polysaccharide transport system permease protein
LTDAGDPTPGGDGTEEERRHAALSLCKARKFAEAARVFRLWSQEGGGAEAALCEARAEFLAGNHQRAREACRRALGGGPHLIRAHLLLAYIARSRGKTGRALLHLNDALALKPQSASLRTQMAELLLQRRQIEAAIRMARESLARDPTSPFATLALARAYAARGNHARARATAGSLVEALPDWRELHEFLEGLLAAADRETTTDVSPLASAPAPQLGQPLHRAAGTITTAGVMQHLFIVRALILRYLHLRYHNSIFGPAMELVRPICIVAAHAVLFDLRGKGMPGNIPVTIFVLAGFSVWFGFHYTAKGAATGERWSRGVTFLPGVTPMHMRLAGAAWPLLSNLAFCLIAVVPLRLIGFDLPLPDLPSTVLIFALAGITGIGFGLLADIAGRISATLKVVHKLLVWSLFITSGLYFSMAHMHHMPPVVSNLVLWNPILHLITLERHAFYAGYPISFVDLHYPLTVAGILMLLGVLAARVVRTPS